MYVPTASRTVRDRIVLYQYSTVSSVGAGIHQSQSGNSGRKWRAISPARRREKRREKKGDRLSARVKPSSLPLPANHSRDIGWVWSPAKAMRWQSTLVPANRPWPHPTTTAAFDVSAVHSRPRSHGKRSLAGLGHVQDAWKMRGSEWMSQGRPEKGTDHEEGRSGIAFP